ncbi:MAG: PASTA domain-containing protein, partial [Syntrophomonadaceae bacterium]|nr:PASTA domain-containing protein [Syntrophomonadaceae bacterium]
ELGGAVSLTVSKGKQVQQTQVPDLVGMTLENAQALLRERQLTLGDITREDSARYFAGQVVRQTVAAGTTVETGTQVGIVVSNGPGPQEQTSSIQVPLPAAQQYYRVVVTVSDVKGVREVFSDIRPGGERVDVEFTSYGPATVEVTLDGQFFKRYRV